MFQRSYKNKQINVMVEMVNTRTIDTALCHIDTCARSTLTMQTTML